MKVRECDKLVDLEIGQKVTVYYHGKGMTAYGEKATFVRETAQHFVFVTDSGATVKTRKNNIYFTVGKLANKWRVTTKILENIAHKEVN